MPHAYLSIDTFAAANVRCDIHNQNNVALFVDLLSYISLDNLWISIGVSYSARQSLPTNSKTNRNENMSSDTPDLALLSNSRSQPNLFQNNNLIQLKLCQWCPDIKYRAIEGVIVNFDKIIMNNFNNNNKKKA